MSTPTLQVRDLKVGVEGNAILRGLSLEVTKGEVHAIMGPNGSGKSTLANTLMGHPKYEVESGDILLNDESVLEMAADERARKGLFLAFQYPTAIPGVTLANFLRMALNARRKDEGAAPIPVKEFRTQMKAAMATLKMDDSFAGRYINEGFSGGEKKRAEILQMAMLKPQVAILDETDSGLDIDALKVVSDGVNAVRGKDVAIVLITHYQRLLNYIKPDFVHVIVAGRIVRSGGPELALQLEEQGYDWLIEAEAEKIGA